MLVAFSYTTDVFTTATSNSKPLWAVCYRKKTVALEGVMALMLTGVAAVCAEAVMVSIVMVIGVEVG